MCLTRSVSQALIPFPAYKNNYARKSFSHTYTKIWNDIPHHIRTLLYTTLLKNTYKLENPWFSPELSDTVHQRNVAWPKPEIVILPLTGLFSGN